MPFPTNAKALLCDIMSVLEILHYADFRTSALPHIMGRKLFWVVVWIKVGGHWIF